MRYSVRVGKRIINDQRVYLADEVFGAFKDKVNFHIDPKGPMEPFHESFKRHQLHEWVVMQFRVYELAHKIKQHDRRIVVHWKN